MTPDPTLEALEGLATALGKPDARGVGLGFTYDEVTAVDEFMMFVVEEFRKQLLVELKDYQKKCAGYQTEFGSGERHTIGNAIYIVENHDYR